MLPIDGILFAHNFAPSENLSLKHSQGARPKRKDAHVLESPWRRVIIKGVEDTFPTQVAAPRAKSKGEWLVTRIKQDGKGITDNSLPLIAHLGDLIARQHHADGTTVSGMPVGLGHFITVGFDPVEILNISAINWPALEKITAPKDRLCLTQAQQIARKRE